MNSAANTPEMIFSSDNIAGASPEVIEALMAANHGAATPYGGDALTARVQMRLSEVFERDVSVLLVPTGTAANSLSLHGYPALGRGTLPSLQPYQQRRMRCARILHAWRSSASGRWSGFKT